MPSPCTTPETTMRAAELAVAAMEPAEVPMRRSAALGSQPMPSCVTAATDEWSPFARSRTQPAKAPRPNRVGKDLDGQRSGIVEVELLDEEGSPVKEGAVGELAVRSRNVMNGYWKRPEETASALRDGWLHTGDMARKDDDGFFYIVDRKKDMIVTGGFNVFAKEVEDAIAAHANVSAVAVIVVLFWLGEPLFHRLGNLNLLIFFVGVVATAVFAINHYFVAHDVTTPIISTALFFSGMIDGFQSLAAVHQLWWSRRLTGSPPYERKPSAGDNVPDAET